LVEIPRFTGAYGALDTSWLPSLGTGIVLPCGVGYVFHSWWKTDEKKKGRNALLGWLITLGILEPSILVPWGISRLRGVALASVVTPGFWEIAWVTIIMISPFIATAAIINGLALQKGSKPKVETTKTETPKVVEVNKPTTREEFKEKYPDLLTMNEGKPLTGKQIMEMVGVPICERTATNWQKYAERGNNGDYAKRITET
jgi:hypothetical protein